MEKQVAVEEQVRQARGQLVREARQREEQHFRQHSDANEKWQMQKQREMQERESRKIIAWENEKCQWCERQQKSVNERWEGHSPQAPMPAFLQLESNNGNVHSKESTNAKLGKAPPTTQHAKPQGQNRQNSLAASLVIR